MINGVEKTRTVIKDGSFQYLTDDAGKPVIALQKLQKLQK